MSRAAKRPPPRKQSKPAAAEPPARTADPSRIPLKELAQRLGLTTRQITNLREGGMPVVSTLGKVMAPWPESMHWYIDNKIATERARDGLGKGEVWKRKAELEIQLAEITVAKALGQVISIDYAAGQWERALFLLRARAIAFPTRMMDEFVLLPDAKAARKKLEEFVTELLTALSNIGDDASFDDVDDLEPEDEPAAEVSA